MAMSPRSFLGVVLPPAANFATAPRGVAPTQAAWTSNPRLPPSGSCRLHRQVGGLPSRRRHGLRDRVVGDCATEALVPRLTHDRRRDPGGDLTEGLDRREETAGLEVL